MAYALSRFALPHSCPSQTTRIYLLCPLQQVMMFAVWHYSVSWWYFMLGESLDGQAVRQSGSQPASAKARIDMQAIHHECLGPPLLAAPLP